MKTNSKNGLKMIVIALVLLLCLALAIGITGAYYQAKRQATGTLSMDQGIVIDYKGFDKTAAEDWATWTRGVTLPLFSTTDAQPGEHITVNAAGIRANTESVDFYARVKLSYKFYNNDTEVTLANTSDLITTSANFFGTNWVDGGSSDGYYYYATGTTLNKFNKGTQTFVDLFATDAEFVIEGENFTGATSDGEGGGFVVGDTSINKIEAYLTLETLQGDADAAAEGWKISQNVDFSKVSSDNISIINSETKTEIAAENIESVKKDVDALNVTIDGKSMLLKNAIFPYDEEVVLNFDSRNVDYITLNYSNGEAETFGLKAEDFANDYLSETALKITAKSSKGTVKGYTVGWFSSKEYEKFTFVDHHIEAKPDVSNTGIGTLGDAATIKNLGEKEVSVTGYWGSDTSIELQEKYHLRKRDFEIEVSTSGFITIFGYFAPTCPALEYPYKIKEFDITINSDEELKQFIENTKAQYDDLNSDNGQSAKFGEEYPTVTFVVEQLVVTSNILYSEYTVKSISSFAFSGYMNAENRNLVGITLPNSIETIGGNAFLYCPVFTTLSLDKENSKLNYIGDGAFCNCDALTTTINDLGGTWIAVERSGGTETEITDNTKKLSGYDFIFSYIKRKN